MSNPTVTHRILREVLAERSRQDEHWGEQNHPDGTGRQPGKAIAAGARLACQMAAAEGTLTWRHIMREEIAEAFEESDSAGLRAELVQVAAVAVAWIEAIDRRTSSAPNPEPPTLALALDGMARLLATSSRDWGEYAPDAWLWALLCGWDCEEDHKHIDGCGAGGTVMQEMQRRHGWSDDAVEKARRYRAAVRELTDQLEVTP